VRTGVLTSTSVLSNTTAPCCASTCQAPTDVTAATVTDSTVMASAVMTSTSVWTGRTGVSRIASTTTAASCASVALVTHCPLKVRCNWFHRPLLQTCRFACVFRDFFSSAKSTQAKQTTILLPKASSKVQKYAKDNTFAKPVQCMLSRRHLCSNLFPLLIVPCSRFYSFMAICHCFIGVSLLYLLTSSAVQKQTFFIARYRRYQPPPCIVRYL